MPIVIQKDMPAYTVMQKENIFVMENDRAFSQDIRPIEIAILNLMPTKIQTETQLIRLLSNSPLQVNLTLLNTVTHKSKNISKEHLQKFYKSFDEIKDKNFDGLIITGAPVETLEYEKVTYWDELVKIMDFAKEKVTSTMFICWGAQAGLYYNYGIKKHDLDNKISGIYPHNKVASFDPLLKGLDDIFYIPHSRHTYIKNEDIDKCDKLTALASSSETGYSIIKSNDNRQIYMFGHSEYERDTLKLEYERDITKGIKIDKPYNYFNEDNNINYCWSSTANLLFSNWLNYYVYQVTPYNFSLGGYNK